jgi:hypothetical protein
MADAGVVDAGTPEDGGTVDDGGASDDGGTPGAPFGAPCSNDNDCQSQICLQTPSGSLCTHTCSNDCPIDYACKSFVLDRNRIVSLCIPFGDVYCLPCGASSECLHPEDRCSDLSGATYCTKDCSQSGGACPAGYECRDIPFAQTAEGELAADGGVIVLPDGGDLDGGDLVFRQCVPVSGKCPGCVDRDGDHYGIGADCLGPDCDDTDPDIHPGAAEICDGKDNNCDGQIDEGFDLQSDDRNCGGCNIACDTAHNQHCCAGTCVDLSSSSDHCGSCTNACSSPLSTCCNGACHSTVSETGNCGGCGQICTNDHGTVACTQGACTPACAGGFGDCDQNPRNGCETATTTLDNCGACGVACQNPHGTTQCQGGVCAPTCDTGYGNCDGDLRNGCETDLLFSTANCSRCGFGCTNDHGATSCEAGLCKPVCDGTWGDCDGNPRNGCETDLLSSDHNCGGCGLVCGTANTASSVCSGGRCRLTCNPGFFDCNGDPRDGCEANLAQVNTCNSCMQDADCPTDFYCAAVGICTRKHQRGDDCTVGPQGQEGHQCLSGFCVDGVCCDTKCDELCRSCKLTGTKGTCNFIPTGEDPDNECPQDPPMTCGRDGFCDGAGACRRYGAATICEAQSCSGSTQRLARSCDGTGQCIPATALTHDCTPYVCDSDACKTSCQSDSDCVAAYTCVVPVNATVGTCKLRQGQACSAPTQCATGNCVDGFCCNTDCAGTCRACNRPGNQGTCTFYDANTDPEGECPDDGRSTCKRDGMCDGAGACRLYAAGTVCVDQICSGQTLYFAQVCDGAGTCSVASSASCAPYSCGGSACRTGCTDNTHCATGYECKDGQCKLSNAQPCSNGLQCASGFCFDGVCCNADCSGPCRSCHYQGSIGTCTLAAPGTDPEDDCAESAQSTCGFDGFCGANGQCRFWGANTPCDVPSCSGATLTNTRYCNGTGTCGWPTPPGQTTDCTPYVCSQGACKTSCQSDNDCLAAYTCVPAGPGLPNVCRLRTSQPCTAPGQCATGHCVDGFCCATDCVGTCRACNRPGFEGTCSMYPAGTDPEGECPDDGRASCQRDGTCDGAGACRLYSSATVCVDQTCVGGVQYNAQMCNGAGACGAQTTTPCFPYLCGGNGCLTSCTDNSQCASGYLCTADGRCKKANGGNCMVDADCAGSPDGGTPHCVDGVCCDTACTGPCRRCNFDGKVGTCSFAPEGSDPDGDCTASDPTTCGLDGFCGPNGQCRDWSNTTQCRNASCSGSILTHAKYCDGNGTCPLPSHPQDDTDCTPYLCAQGACKTSCMSDSDCVSNYTCSSGACKLRQGQPCGNTTQCAAGLTCVDGFCCDTPCNGTCQACNVANAQGHCTNYPQGTDPEGECPDEGALSCGKDGFCNGAGACRLYSASTVCVPQTCSNGTVFSARTCDGIGTCLAGTSTSCFPYIICNASQTACPTSCSGNSDCSTNYVCSPVDGGSVCKKAGGSSCTSDSDCAATGDGGAPHCVDGVCCNSDCTGPCRRCDFPGNVGTCTFATSGTDPDNDCGPLATLPATCGLDGLCGSGGQCRDWSSTTQCRNASCSGSKVTYTRYCDGAGTCPTPPPSGDADCLPYMCSQGACLTSCQSDADCTSDYTCVGPPNGVCKLRQGKTCSSGTQCASGFCADGYCCNNDCTGPCRACNLTNTQGTCTAYTAGTDPEGECNDDGRQTCQHDGMCDGFGACRLYSSSTICVDQTCAGSTQFNAQTCNGAGTCNAGTTTSCFPYVCSGNACRTTCTVNGDCVAGYSCAADHTCKIANSGSCNVDADCTSGHCFDHVCCDVDCSGPCRRCDFAGKVGVCTNALDGTDPDNDCTAGDPSTCGLDGFCGPNGACRYWNSSTQCLAASCSGATLTNTKLCNGTGTCQWPSPPGQTTDCSPYICAQGACKTSCQTDSDCIGTYTCVSGVCKLRQGQICSTGTQCASGFCVDGYCCNNACNGTCRACNLAPSPGTCTFYAPNTDPEGECPDDGASSCQRDGMCDGAGACRLYSSSTVCVAQSCTGSTQFNARLCNGSGTCTTGTTTNCSPYTCGTTACRTSCTDNTQCVSGYQCAGGQCKQVNGSSCTSGSQCASGECWDGVCCNTNCSGICRRCDFSGAVGTCSFATPGTDPDNDCTQSVSTTCGLDGQCGAGGVCRYWDTTTLCQASSCTGNTQTNTKLCNGSGTCVWPGTQTTDCSPYRCGATTCKTSCTADTDCIGGYYCAAPTCVLKKPVGGSCSGDNQCQSGKCCNSVCVDPTTDINNCGGCGIICSNPHGTTSCSGSLCQPVCSGFWKDCDGNRNNGCETAIDTTSNCGNCGVSCARTNAYTTCPSGVCTLSACYNGFADCDGNTNNGCELQNSGYSDGYPGEYLGEYDADRASGFFCTSDSCSLAVSRTGTTGRYFYVIAHENSDCPADLGVEVQLIVPPGIDYDLYVTGGDTCASGCYSVNGTGQNETIFVNKADNYGSDDTFTLYIEVRFYSGSSCSPWTLNVYTRNC